MDWSKEDMSIYNKFLKIKDQLKPINVSKEELGIDIEIKIKPMEILMNKLENNGKCWLFRCPECDEIGSTIPISHYGQTIIDYHCINCRSISLPVRPFTKEELDKLFNDEPSKGDIK